MRKSLEKTQQHSIPHRRAQGRIARDEWANIARRRHTGESISGIARSYGVTSAAIRYVLRKADAAEREPGDTRPEQPVSEVMPMPAETTCQSPLADRLRAATQHCCGVIDELGESLVATDNLKAAIHEIRRAIAAIEIEASKGRYKSRPATAETSGAVPGDLHP